MCICASALSVFVFVRMCKWKVDFSDSEQVFFFRRWICQCKLPVVRRYLKQIHLASVPLSKVETTLSVFKTILGPSTSCDTFFSFNLKMLETSTTFIPKKVISDFHHSCFFPQLTWIQRLDQKVWRRHPLPGRSKDPRSKRTKGKSSWRRPGQNQGRRQGDLTAILGFGSEDRSGRGLHKHLHHSCKSTRVTCRNTCTTCTNTRKILVWFAYHLTVHGLA